MPGSLARPGQTWAEAACRPKCAPTFLSSTRPAGHAPPSTFEALWRSWSCSPLRLGSFPEWRTSEFLGDTTSECPAAVTDHFWPAEASADVCSRRMELHPCGGDGWKGQAAPKQRLMSFDFVRQRKARQTRLDLQNPLGPGLGWRRHICRHMCIAAVRMTMTPSMYM